MPRYEVTTNDELTVAEKTQLATDVTEIHARVTGAPPGLVHVMFHTLGEGNHFVGGQLRESTFLEGSIRAGRDVETITKLIDELGTAVVRAIGTPPADVVVAIREGAPHLVSEGGIRLPKPGDAREAQFR